MTGVVFYLNSNSIPEVRAVLALDTAQNHGCAVVEDGTGFYGSATVDAALVNSGWSIN